MSDQVTATQAPEEKPADVQATPVPAPEATPKAEAKPAAPPSFFVEPTDRVRVDVDVLWHPESGRPVSVSKVGIGARFEEIEYLKHTVEWFEFSIPGYEDVANYRQRSSVYRREAGGMVVDRGQMRNFLLVWHLRDWSLRGRDGNKVPLVVEEAGCLHDDSVKAAMSVPSGILDAVLSLLEKELMLS